MKDYIDTALDAGLMSMEAYYELEDAAPKELLEETEHGAVYISEPVNITSPDICIHEAGHAIIGYLQGRKVKHVYAGPFEDTQWDAYHKEYYTQDLAGQVAYEGDDILEPAGDDGTAVAARIKKRMLGMMGGGAAQALFEGGEPARHLCPSDESAMYGNWLLEYCNLIGAFENPPFDMPDAPSEEQEERWWEWTEEITNEVETKLWAEVKDMLLNHWHLVEGLAAVLYADPYLDGPQVYEILDRIRARRAALDSAGA